MSNADLILQAIEHSDGLTDAELVRRTGIRSHQQVNQICRKLVAQGWILREVGRDGQIANSSAPSDLRAKSRETALRMAHTALGREYVDAGIDGVSHLDPTTNLLVIPCSATKTGGGTAQRGPGLCDVLPKAQADRLRKARDAVHDRAGINESQLMPAWQRYSGTFFAAASGDLGQALANGANIVILSGGYGAVLATEPIGTYDARFKLTWWPSDVVGESIAEYARVRGLGTIVAFLAASTDYAKVVTRIRAGSARPSSVYVISPDAGGHGGAQRIVPRALGEATASFLRHELRADWTSSDGIPLRAQTVT